MRHAFYRSLASRSIVGFYPKERGNPLPAPLPHITLVDALRKAAARRSATAPSVSPVTRTIMFPPRPPALSLALRPLHRAPATSCPGRRNRHCAPTSRGYHSSTSPRRRITRDRADRPRFRDSAACVENGIEMTGIGCPLWRRTSPTTSFGRAANARVADQQPQRPSGVVVPIAG